MRFILEIEDRSVQRNSWVDVSDKVVTLTLMIEEKLEVKAASIAPGTEYGARPRNALVKRGIRVALPLRARPSCKDAVMPGSPPSLGNNAGSPY